MLDIREKLRRQGAATSEPPPQKNKMRFLGRRTSGSAPERAGCQNLRAISEIVAIEVAKAAVADGVARIKHDDIKQAVRNAMWEPVYRPIKAAKETVMV